MQVFSINPLNIRHAVDYLKKGGVVIHPTDTCYGIAADITNQKAVEKVIQLKQMSAEKPMSILVSDLEMLEKYAVLSDEAKEIAHKYFPGALTLVLSKTKLIPAFYAPETDLIGVRIPNDIMSLEMVKLLGNPVTTTSANLTQKSPAYDLEQIKLYFQNQDLLVLDGGILEKKLPSTIVQITTEQIKVLRQGELEFIPDYCPKDEKVLEGCR